MRQILFSALFALGLVAIAPASLARTHMHATTATAATMYHSRHHVHLSPKVASSFDAAPPQSYDSPVPSAHYDDTPSYDDPSKFGGSTALSIN